MALPLIAQDDFSAGSVLSVARHLIPRTGARLIVDGLLDDDGSVYRRGGSVYKSSAEFSSGGLRFLWDGFLPAVGARTLFATSSAFGTLASNDATPVSLGGGGVTEPVASAQIGDFLWIGGGKLYAGSRIAGPYSTGTVAGTVGSTTITGTGTSWSTNIDAGTILALADDAQRFYVVASVTDNTHLELTEPFIGGANFTGGSYSARAIATATTGLAGGRVSGIYGQAGGRLLTLDNEVLHFSNGVDPATGRLRPQIFGANDYHRLPVGARGVALATLRDRALVFTTAGMWMVSNLALNLTDAQGTVQQRLEQVSSDLIGWGAGGVTSYRNAAVVACTDGVYLLDGISAPVRLSKAITPRYVGYVRAGHKPGQMAVFRNHLFLPVFSSAGAWVDTMVCRLDRPTDTSIGKLWPWTFLTGHAASVTSLAPRVSSGSSRSPALLASGTDGRVLDLSALFEPATAVRFDALSVEQPHPERVTFQLVVETRDYRTSLSGSRNRNLARKLRARYELVDDRQTVDLDGDGIFTPTPAEGAPYIRAFVSTGKLSSPASTKWGAFLWGTGTWGDATLDELETLTGQAPAADSRSPWTWAVNKKAEFVRFRLESGGSSGTCVLRSIDVAVRQSRKDF